MQKPNIAGYSEVVIVGLGQLGSRHLQGLAKSEAPLRIWAVDPNPASLSLAQQRWVQVGGEQTAHLLELSSLIQKVPRKLDLAMITTNADVRERVVRDIASHADVRYWVLEKVLAQSCESLDAMMQLTSGASGRWVNTPRRMMVWHQQLHEALRNQQPLHVRLGDNLWGLACSAIHFLDLVAWWSDSTLVSVAVDGLDSQWIASKRPSFYEVTGTLEATYANGTTLILESHANGKALEIQIDTPQGQWKVKEAEGVMTGPDGLRISGRNELQSEMSTRLVDSILATGRCDLPSLEASVQIHRPFLQSMLAHWNLTGMRDDSLVPVT